jgi:hypothetical protein
MKPLQSFSGEAYTLVGQTKLIWIAKVVRVVRIGRDSRVSRVIRFDQSPIDHELLVSGEKWFHLARFFYRVISSHAIFHTLVVILED